MPRQKWYKTPDGMFECPELGCDKVGENAYTTSQGLGGHIQVKHPALWKQIERTGEVPPVWSHASAPANGNGPHPFAPPLGLAPGTVLVNSDMPRTAAVKAMTAILNLAEVVALNSGQLKKVMEHACAVKGLDEDIQNTGATGMSRPDERALHKMLGD